MVPAKTLNEHIFPYMMVVIHNVEQVPLCVFQLTEKT